MCEHLGCVTNDAVVHGLGVLCVVCVGGHVQKPAVLSQIFITEGIFHHRGPKIEKKIDGFGPPCGTTRSCTWCSATRTVSTGTRRKGGSSGEADDIPVRVRVQESLQNRVSHLADCATRVWQNINNLR